jgi:Domain of unknown function (DUF6265)
MENLINWSEIPARDFHTFKFFIMLACAGTILSCNNAIDRNTTKPEVKTYSELEKASWLIGQWQNNSAEGNATEIWEKKSDSTYYGKSCFVIGKDTVSSEIISLEQHGNQLFYIPTVKSQNGGQPVKFTLTSSANNQLIFENPKHDFPQIISYTKISIDSLVAEISGAVNGKEQKQAFPMKRAK